MDNVNLSAPWMEYKNEVEILFGGDPEVNVQYVDDEKKIKLYVDNGDKAAALEKILPDHVDFGNVTLKIEIIPENRLETLVSTYETAFAGNDNFCFAQKNGTPPMPSLTYVVFKPNIAQFFNDNLQDLWGNENVLLQDVARKVLKPNDEVCFCTIKLEETNG